MQKLYSLKYRRILYTYYYLNRFQQWNYLAQVYRFMNSKNYISNQFFIWVNVYMRIEKNTLLFGKIHWVCFISGRYRSISRLFTMSRLSILNQLAKCDWNCVLNNTK